MPISSDFSALQDFRNLWEPIQLRGLTLPNRVLMAPLEKNLCTADGVMTQRYIDYLTERAAGGVGLLRVEATYVDPVGKGRPFQVGAHGDHVIPQLQRMAATVHDAGGRVSLELAHCGRQTNSLISGFQPVAPSAVPCELSGGFLPRELTAAEIHRIVEKFVEAALRGQKAGLDAIEIHGASGYLLNAFMSPYTNKRSDEYGGSLEKRMRFPLEVVRAVREAIDDDLPLLYRMSAHDYVDGGLTESDSVPFARQLELAGVDLIDVSAGTYESITKTQPPMEAPAGGLLELAAAIKAAVEVPVSTAGKFGSLEVAEAALSSGMVDLVSIARGLHADPSLLEKARSGRLQEARRCIACAECVGFLNKNEPAYCAINPATARESELRIRPTQTAHAVAVVGGGPAGMEAARGAALRGHTVTLYERSNRLGGRVPLGARARGREDFAEPVRFLERELERLKVDIRLNTVVDAAFLAALDAESLVIATGAAAVRPPIPGLELPHVVSALDLLDNESHERRGSSAVLIGGGWIGCHAADLLSDLGYAVTVVEIGGALGSDIGMQQGSVLRDRVASRCSMRLQHSVVEVRASRVTIWDSVTGEYSDLAADVVVTAPPMEPRTELAEVARLNVGTEVFVVGDAARPRDLASAIYEGARAGQFA